MAASDEKPKPDFPDWWKRHVQENRQKNKSLCICKMSAEARGKVNAVHTSHKCENFEQSTSSLKPHGVYLPKDVNDSNFLLRLYYKGKRITEYHCVIPKNKFAFDKQRRGFGGNEKRQFSWLPLRTPLLTFVDRDGVRILLTFDGSVPEREDTFPFVVKFKYNLKRQELDPVKYVLSPQLCDEPESIKLRVSAGIDVKDCRLTLARLIPKTVKGRKKPAELEEAEEVDLLTHQRKYDAVPANLRANSSGSCDNSRSAPTSTDWEREANRWRTMAMHFEGMYQRILSSHERLKMELKKIAEEKDAVERNYEKLKRQLEDAERRLNAMPPQPTPSLLPPLPLPQFGLSLHDGLFAATSSSLGGTVSSNAPAGNFSTKEIGFLSERAESPNAFGVLPLVQATHSPRRRYQDSDDEDFDDDDDDDDDVRSDCESDFTEHRKKPRKNSIGFQRSWGNVKQDESPRKSATDTTNSLDFLHTLPLPDSQNAYVSPAAGFSFGALSPHPQRSHTSGVDSNIHSSSSSSSRAPSARPKRRLSSSSEVSRMTAPTSSSTWAPMSGMGDYGEHKTPEQIQNAPVAHTFNIPSALLNNDMVLQTAAAEPIFVAPPTPARPQSAPTVAVYPEDANSNDITPKKELVDVIKDAVIRSSVAGVCPPEVYNKTSRLAVVAEPGPGPENEPSGDFKFAARKSRSQAQQDPIDSLSETLANLKIDPSDIANLLKKSESAKERVVPTSSAKPKSDQSIVKHERGMAVGDEELREQIMKLLTAKNTPLSAIQITKTLPGEILKKDVNRVLYQSEKFGQVRMERNGRGKPIWSLAC